MATIKIKRGTGAPSSLAEGELAIDVSASKLYANAKENSGDADNIVVIGGGDSLGVSGITSTATSEKLVLSDTKFVQKVDMSFLRPSFGIDFTSGTTTTTTPEGRFWLNTSTQMILECGFGNQSIRINSSPHSIELRAATTVDGQLDANGGFISADDATINSITFGRGNSGNLVSLAVGINALSGDSSANDFNTAIGSYSQSASHHDCNWSTSVGAYSLNNVRLGDGCTAIGYDALTNNYDGAYNVAVGMDAAESNTDGSQNTAVGYQALQSNTTNGQNVAVGATALINQTGSGNTAVGHSSGNAITTGANNVSIGYQAHNGFGGNNTTGSQNVAVGYLSARNATTGNYNTMLGSLGGYNATSGDNNTCIGYSSQASSSTVSNEITLGNSSISSLRCQVTNISGLSDARDKTAVEPLSGASDFIRALNPVSFEWNQRDGNRIGEKDHGFIAQDLQEVQSVTGYEVPRLVLDENPEKLEAAYGTLLPTIVAALQEALIEIESLKAQLGNS